MAWINVSSALQKETVGSVTSYRFNLGAAGFFNLSADQAAAIQNLLPLGNIGQHLRYSNSGSNMLIPKYIMPLGKYVVNDTELAAAKSTPVTQQDIFNEAFRYAHGQQDPDNPDAGFPSNAIPGAPLATNSFAYDSELDRFYSTYNSNPHLGLVYPLKASKYRHKATLSSSGADNDRIGLCISFLQTGDVNNNANGLSAEDFDWNIPIGYTESTRTSNEYTITVFRNRDNIDPQYAIYYNYRKLDQKLLVDGTSLVWNTLTNWSGASVDLEVVREENMIYVRTTNMSDAPGGKGSLGFQLTFDLLSDPLTEKFNVPCQFGLMVRSQINSSWTNIERIDGSNEIFAMHTGEVWVLDSEGEWVTDPDRNVYVEIMPGTFLGNPDTGKIIYVDESSNYRVWVESLDGLTEIINQEIIDREDADDVLADSILANTQKVSNLITPVAIDGSVNYVDVPQTINNVGLYAVLGLSVYRVANSLSDSECTFNPVNGRFTFPVQLYGPVWVAYKNAISDTGTSTIVYVQNYSDIIMHSTWGGAEEVTYYVLTDNNGSGGEKGAYKYIPNFTDVPAQIAINFN